MEQLAQIVIDQGEDVVVARVAGEVDISNAASVRRELTSAVPNSALGLVVDLSDAAHLDSSGIYLLFELASALDSRQQRICIVAPPAARSTRVLTITGLDKLMPVESTIDEALGSIRSVAR